MQQLICVLRDAQLSMEHTITYNSKIEQLIHSAHQAVLQGMSTLSIMSA